MQPTAPGEGVSSGWPPRRPAYHRARCASTSSPGPPSHSGSTSCGRSPRSLERYGLAGYGWGAAWLGGGGKLGSYRDVRAFRDDPGRETVGATETTSALVHLRRPSRLSTLTLSDTQPFDDPAGRFAFSHNGDLRDYKELRATYRAAGRIHGRADTEVGARWLEDEWRPDASAGAQSWRRSTIASAGRRTSRSWRPTGRCTTTRATTRTRSSPSAWADRDRVDRDLLARSLAVPIRRPHRHGSHADPLAYDCHTRPDGRHSIVN